MFNPWEYYSNSRQRHELGIEYKLMYSIGLEDFINLGVQKVSGIGGSLNEEESHCGSWLQRAHQSINTGGSAGIQCLDVKSRILTPVHKDVCALKPSEQASLKETSRFSIIRRDCKRNTSSFFQAGESETKQEIYHIVLYPGLNTVSTSLWSICVYSQVMLNLKYELC